MIKPIVSVFTDGVIGEFAVNVFLTASFISLSCFLVYPTSPDSSN
jgi:hypothetical protein